MGRKRRKRKWNWRRIAFGLLVLMRETILGLLMLTLMSVDLALRLKDKLCAAMHWCRRRGWRELPFELIKFYVEIVVITVVMDCVVALPAAAWVSIPLLTADQLNWHMFGLVWMAGMILGLPAAFYAVCLVGERRESVPIKNEVLSLMSTTVGYVVAVSVLRLVVENFPGLLQSRGRGGSSLYNTATLVFLAVLFVCVMVATRYCLEGAIYCVGKITCRAKSIVRVLRTWKLPRRRKTHIVPVEAESTTMQPI